MDRKTKRTFVRTEVECQRMAGLEVLWNGEHHIWSFEDSVRSSAGILLFLLYVELW